MKFSRNIIGIIMLLGLAGLFSACSNAVNAGIVPAEGKLTFLFFFTDG